MSRRIRLAAVAKALGLGATLVLAVGLLGLLRFPEGPEAVPESAELRPLPGRSPGTDALIENLRRTNLLNGEAVYRGLGLGSADRKGFRTKSPYESLFRGSVPAQERILRWHSSLSGNTPGNTPRNTEVCGVRFTGPDRTDYSLRSFPDPESALSAGYVITHRNHCGTCSSLRDFAAYLARPDLTTPARNCARRLTAAGMKACFMEGLGFSERCAETWTHNSLHTRRHCLGVCIGHYGLSNVLTGNISAPHSDERGNLNPCLACDEDTSGPGFQYMAGRTRRSSGLTSAITRPAAEIYPVDHTRYFR